MFKIILIILLAMFSYALGADNSKRETLEKIKYYIKRSKDWNEFMEILSVEFNRYNIGE